jgi:hypothetical protein
MSRGLPALPRCVSSLCSLREFSRLETYLTQRRREHREEASAEIRVFSVNLWAFHSEINACGPLRFRT